MRQQQKQQGLSLIEVLVTLSILSITGIIVWNVFFQGLSFSQKSISENLMLQEANIIITSLKNNHQSSIKYELESKNCEVIITENEASSEVFTHPNLCFKLENLKVGDLNQGQGPATIEPHKHKQDVSFSLKISERNKEKNSISLDSFLYRIKGADYN